MSATSLHITYQLLHVLLLLTQIMLHTLKSVFWRYLDYRNKIINKLADVFGYTYMIENTFLKCEWNSFVHYIESTCIFKVHYCCQCMNN